MNDLWKTLTFVAVALVLDRRGVRDHQGSHRSATRPSTTRASPSSPRFKDPLACTDLEVVEFDPSTATASRFRVMFKDNKWVIPSHYDYPADAETV